MNTWAFVVKELSGFCLFVVLFSKENQGTVKTLEGLHILTKWLIKIMKYVFGH